jgi:uncharacterized membrane protein YfcA
MTPVAVIAVVLAGLVAGAINAVAGSGGLITFPILLGIGYSPVVANVTNTVPAVACSAARVPRRGRRRDGCQAPGLVGPAAGEAGGASQSRWRNDRMAMPSMAALNAARTATSTPIGTM